MGYRKRRFVSVAVAGVVIATVSLTAVAHPGTSDTSVLVDAGGTIELKPGLCGSSDGSASCSGPYEGQWRLRSTSCSVSGTLEERSLPSDAACALSNVGFSYALFPGVTKPSCASDRGETSAAAKAFGPKPVNKITLAGTERNDYFAWGTRGVFGAMVTGWVDDADGDTNPVGDHQLAGTLWVNPGTEVGPCFTTPLTAVEFRFVARIT